MKDYLGDAIKGILDLITEAWEEGYFWYLLIALIIFVILLFFNKGLLAPSEIFN